MINERHEELAALAALDLLSAPEQAELTAALAQNPGLQKLIDSLRDAAAQLAHTAASVEPPAALKARLLAHVAVIPPSAAKAEILEFKNPEPGTQNSKPSFFSLAGWAVAACLALTSAWLGQNYLNAQRLSQTLREQQALADLTLRSTQNHLEAERLIAQRELADATARATESARTLAALQTRFDAATAAAGDLSSRLATNQSQLDLARTQLADAALALATREQRLADLTRQLKEQGDLANLKIATLASLAGNTPQAIAVAVWNPVNQQGVLSVQKLPALAANKDYQLWVVDPQYPAPVNGGVFTVDPATGDARMVFHPDQPVKTAAKFAISLERKGGVPKADGTILFVLE